MADTASEAPPGLYQSLEPEVLADPAPLCARLRRESSVQGEAS